MKERKLVITEFEEKLVEELSYDGIFFFIEKGIIPSKVDHEPAICWAVRQNSAEAVHALIVAGVDVTVNHNYAIKLAAWLGYTEMVVLLYEAGADITVEQNKPLQNAAKFGHFDTVKAITDIQVKLQNKTA